MRKGENNKNHQKKCRQINDLNTSLNHSGWCLAMVCDIAYGASIRILFACRRHFGMHRPIMDGEQERELLPFIDYPYTQTQTGEWARLLVSGARKSLSIMLSVGKMDMGIRARFVRFAKVS